MRPDHKTIVLDYISQRQGEHISNETIADALELNRQAVARVMHYIMKRNDKLCKVRRGVWVFNPKTEVVTEKSPIIQLIELFEQKGTVSTSEISQRLGIPKGQVSMMIKRLRAELNAEVSRENHYTFEAWV